MIKHDDWDTLEDAKEQDYVLPERIDSIDVSYDGGRLEIRINEQCAYSACEGTRDCTVTLDRRVLGDESKIAAPSSDHSASTNKLLHLLAEAAQTIRNLSEDLDGEDADHARAQVADIEETVLKMGLNGA